jgi:hypothetical protein
MPRSSPLAYKPKEFVMSNRLRVPSSLSWLFCAFFAFFFASHAQAQDNKPKDENKAPAAKPADPNAKPADPNAKPADPNAKPADPNAKPADPNAKPADPLQSAGVSPDRHRFQLLSIEEKTSSLKEKIFRSKAKLMLLQESLLQGAISTGKIIIVHDNQMGASFYLRSISYNLSGNPIFNKTDYEGSLNNSKAKKFVAFTNTLQPGRYTLSVDLLYRGDGLGVFSYLKKYNFRIRSSYTFQVQEGKSVEVSVVAFEKNPLTSQLTDRPAVRYDMKIRDLTAKPKNLQQEAKK